MANKPTDGMFITDQKNMSTQVERSTVTRATILDVARVAFVREGFDGISLEKIAKDAGVTKGALYHHYSGKEALFIALFCLVSSEVVTEVGKQVATRVGTPRDRLKAAAQAWLSTVEVGDARAILLDLGPRVLGFERARQLEDEIERQQLLGLVRAVIEAENLKNAIDKQLVARLISASISEIALLRHASDGRFPSMPMAHQAMANLIDGILK